VGEGKGLGWWWCGRRRARRGVPVSSWCVLGLPTRHAVTRTRSDVSAFEVPQIYVRIPDSFTYVRKTYSGGVCVDPGPAQSAVAGAQDRRNCRPVVSGSNHLTPPRPPQDSKGGGEGWSGQSALASTSTG
jgi:hypothetical protein